LEPRILDRVDGNRAQEVKHKWSSSTPLMGI